ncbi:hypothetical protein [Marinifilum fragile]|uniref:hypothetical protein n=1 Tax=Marinifilum fragile TaxID=570161 RepID=UPI002AA8A319|nr:hypothetical protein [Marinifilum fragile]
MAVLIALKKKHITPDHEKLTAGNVGVNSSQKETYYTIEPKGTARVKGVYSFQEEAYYTY